MTSGTIIIADDHPLFRDALRHAIEGMATKYDVATAGDFDEALDVISSTANIDLVLLDLNMPGNKGFSGLMRIRADFPALPVVIVSALEDSATISRSLEFGASGYIPKSTDAGDIARAIETVLAGEIWLPPDIDINAEDTELSDMMQRLQSLTPQQSRVLGMLGEGLLNKQIAYELSVSEATVKAHVSAVLTKLGVDSRTQAVIILGKLGIGESQ
ncbi:MAG: response regulator transcription factor [Rhizobiaceae bacterium]